MSRTVLVRYGIIPEVARFSTGAAETYSRGERVVVQSHRGLEVGVVLETVATDAEAQLNNGEQQDEQQDSPTVLRACTSDDERQMTEQQAECHGEFGAWRRRIAEWDLELELIDLEWLLDRSKLVLYVLNDRGADCTKLAIYAAAEGLGPVEVQPVDAGGLVPPEPAGGGCGTGGCGTCGTDP